MTPPRRSRHIETAALVAIGSELLTPFRIDTNSLWITRQLNELAIEVKAKTVVGDEPRPLQTSLRQMLKRVDLVVTTGGLGPTADDLTRDAVASVVEQPLEEAPELLERIRLRFESRGMRMPEINRRQAQVVRGARVLENPNGTAPGLWIERGSKSLLLLPGPPREMQPMFHEARVKFLAERARPGGLFRRALRVTGCTESQVEETAQPIYSRWADRPQPIATTILASPGQIELHLSIRAASRAEADASLDPATQELAAALGANLFSTDGSSLEEVVGQALRRRNLRIALAESCTGGLTASRLTDVPGSSAYVEAALVCYSNRAKMDLAAVPEALIHEHGAVSEEVALALAEGASRRTGSDVGLGITGIAGPEGGSERKPVGTVAIAVTWAGERAGARTYQHARTYRFPGNRDQVKFQASQAGLDAVRRMLLE